MKVVCGYQWGIWWWRTSPPDTRIPDVICNVSRLEGCLGGMGVLKDAGLFRLRDMGIERGIPKAVSIDILVNKRVGHQSSNQVTRHLMTTTSVPPGALSCISKGVYVFTPAFCVLQVASIARRLVGDDVGKEFALVIVARVACEMCGSYSISNGKSGLVKRVPLMTVAELATLVIVLPAAKGVGLLRTAIPYIIPNTRSPKETDVFLLLCLPPRLGGFGLPRPQSNYAIDLRAVRAGFFANWPSCTVDFYWGQVRLIVEYDSRDYHDEQGEEKVRQDEERAQALRELGYVVVTVRRNDLYSARLFRAKVQEIADALMLELPAATPEFVRANETLRMMLLRHDRWV